MTTTLTALGLAAGISIAVLLIIAGATPTAPQPRTHRNTWSRIRTLVGSTRRVQLVLLGLALGIGAMLISGWVMMIVLGPIIAVGLAAFFRESTPRIDLEVLAGLDTWTRSLVGLTVGGGLTLTDAITASLDSAPPALRGSVSRLVARIEAQQPLERAMRLWADEIDDRLADVIAATIIQGSRLRQGGVAKSLSSLADSVQDHVRVREDVEAERAMPRWVVRVVALISTGMLVLGMLNPATAAPYATPLGQVVLVLLVGAFMLTLLWMRRISAGRPIPRFLNANEELTS